MKWALCCTAVTNLTGFWSHRVQGTQVCAPASACGDKNRRGTPRGQPRDAPQATRTRPRLSRVRICSKPASGAGGDETRGVGTVTACPRDRGPAAQPAKMQSPDPGDWRTRMASEGFIPGHGNGCLSQEEGPGKRRDRRRERMRTPAGRMPTLRLLRNSRGRMIAAATSSPFLMSR